MLPSTSKAGTVLVALAALALIAACTGGSDSDIGTPTTTGTYPFTVQVDDGSTTVFQPLSIAISASAPGKLVGADPLTDLAVVKIEGDNLPFTGLGDSGTLGAGGLLNYFHEDYARMCAVISLVYAFGLIFIWFCPETKNRPLPE